MPDQITGERLTSLFHPRSVALVGASDKSMFSMLAHRNLVKFGFGAHTYLVNRRGTPTHGRPTDDLTSLEVNPLLVDGASIETLDAVVTWTAEEDSR